MLRLLPAAALGLGLEAQRRSLDAAVALGARLAPPLSAAARPAAALAGRPLAVAWRRLDLDGWAARGLAEQRRNQQAAAVAARALVAAIAAAVLDQVDVDAVVARVDLDRIVDRLGLAPYFAGVYGAEFGGKFGEFKEDLLAHLFASERVAPEDAVMIGDRAGDIVAARAHRVRSIGALWGYGSEAELLEAGADALCASPKELIACLSRFSS